MILIFTPSNAEADEIRDRQWHLAALRIPEAQSLSQGDGVLVAVADTGVDARRGELAEAVTAGKEFGEQANGDGRTDTDGHGTAMAGLIAGRGLADGSGVLGIAPKAQILPVRTIRSEFGGSPANLGAGIEWAVSRGARVICVAAGTSEYPEIKRAVEVAIRSDVVVVASAGNTTTAQHVAFPASLPGVVAVAGTGKQGDHADISATGPEVVLAAPAVDIVSTGAFGKYVTGDGTSNSTAIVAGVVALVRAKFPRLSAAEVIRRLTATATDRGKPGRDDEYGYGIVNPVAALTAELPAVAPGGSPAATGQGETPGRGVVGVAAGWVVVGVGVVGGVVVWWVRRRTR
ncbi:S8 family serine peptidase [Dactylosporangium sp. NBC_01737]|uniref:S8 family serine peptidase n=1 Tax=Dactylosporangium sp. NBC_01737 TaxID=2975959 RepID=UPI002E0EC278|nr:S8 family serine peptidase [Dactylosporangium sp. NBC_01737]